MEGNYRMAPISSTGHLILVEEFVKLNFSQSYLDMFNVVMINLVIMAVVVIYFHQLNPFHRKDRKRKNDAAALGESSDRFIPAGVVGIPCSNDFIEEKFNNSYVVADADRSQYSVV